MIKHSEEFKRETVHIALTSGLPRDRVAADLGIGKSTLGKWLAQYRPTDLTSAPQADLARENERLWPRAAWTCASATRPRRWRVNSFPKRGSHASAAPSWREIRLTG